MPSGRRAVALWLFLLVATAPVAGTGAGSLAPVTTGSPAPATAGSTAPAGSSTAPTGSSTAPPERPAAAARAGPAGPVFAGPTAQRGPPASPVPNATVAVTRTGDAVELTVTYRVPEGVSTLRVAHGRTTVVSSRGFAACGDRRVCWDGSSTPSVTLRYDVADQRGTRNAIVAEDRLFVRAPSVATVWRTAEGRSASPLSAAPTRGGARVTGEAVLGDTMLYVGAHGLHARTANGTAYRLVVPAGVEPRASPTAVLDAVTAAAGRFDVGGHTGDVTLFVFDDPPRVTRGTEAAGATVGRTAWVASSASGLHTAHNTWFHEYVHTRQRFGDRAREMEWFVEASAQYYAARLSYETGLVSRPAFEFEVAVRTPGVSDDVLADPATWTSGATPYEKGALVLAALDERIRNRTGGERTLEDVVRRLNRRDRPLTYAAFADAVVAVTGDPGMRAWLDRYVRSGAVPDYETSGVVVPVPGGRPITITDLPGPVDLPSLAAFYRLSPPAQLAVAATAAILLGAALSAVTTLLARLVRGTLGLVARLVAALRRRR